MIYKCLKCSYISPLKTNVIRHIVSKHRDDVETLIESSENMESVNYFIYLSNPKESISKLVSEAQLKNIEVGIYRY